VSSSQISHAGGRAVKRPGIPLPRLSTEDSFAFALSQEKENCYETCRQSKSKSAVSAIAKRSAKSQRMKIRNDRPVRHFAGPTASEKTFSPRSLASTCFGDATPPFTNRQSSVHETLNVQSF